jgi:hypothetical protein
MTTLTVGPGKEYSTLSAAVAASRNGDVIQVQAGTYTNDFSIVTTSITIEGVGGMVNLVATVPPSNGKGILVIGTATTSPTVTLDNLEFSGAAISAAQGGNAAGVRYQSGNLTINNSYFHNNQDGLLANDDASGSITITNTEFANNGTSTGLTHNIYIGAVGSFSISGSYITAANTGNEIQSRALVNNITNNRIVDGPTATASYSINLPNGGVDTVTGNSIEQGPHSQNPAIISFGASGSVYAGSSLTISNNTILNDEPAKSARAVTNFSKIPVNFTNNSVWGLTSAQIATGPVNVSGTTYLTTEPIISNAPPYQTQGQVSADTITLQLSTDAAQTPFAGWLNGEELGAPQHVTALRQDSAIEGFSFSGNWGAGAKTLTVESLGGTGASSHVYVDGIVYNGVHYAGSPEGLLPDQKESFTVGHSLPADAS